MPRLTEEQARRRRERIIEAALRCFARDGLHHTSMSDLFAEAGMSAGSVYSWFDSKDDIIEAAYKGSGTGSAEAIAAMLDDDDRLRGIAQVLRHAAAMFDDEHWRMTSRVNVQLWGEAPVNARVRDSFLDDFRTYRRLLTVAIADAQRAGDVAPSVEPSAAAAAVWGMYLGLEAQKAWEPDLDHHAYVRAAVALVTGRFAPVA